MQNRIRELRKQRGITMKELGKVVGVAESTISHYETGKRQPDNHTLLALAEYFGVSVDYLLGKPQPSVGSVMDLFAGTGMLNLPGVTTDYPPADPNTQKLLSLSRDMTDEEKRQLLLAARLIIEQRSEK